MPLPASPSLGRVLVTGGAAFIGTTPAREHAQSAEQWVVLDNLHLKVSPGSEPPADLPATVDPRVGAVTNAADLDGLVAELRSDTVVHPAAQTGTAQSYSESAHHGRVNVVGFTGQPGLRTHSQPEAPKRDHGYGAAHLPHTVDGTHPNPVSVCGANKLDVRHAACDVEVTLHEVDRKPRVSLREGVAALQERTAQELDR